MKNVISILFLFIFVSCSKPKEIIQKAKLFCIHRDSDLNQVMKLKKEKYKVICKDKSQQTISLNENLRLFNEGECIKFPERIPFMNKNSLRFTKIISPTLKILKYNKNKKVTVKVFPIKTTQIILENDLNRMWKSVKCPKVKK